MNADSYIYGTSFYHVFDPRPKLLFTLLYAFLSFFVSSWYGMVLFPLVACILFALSLGFGELWKGAKRILPVVILLLVFLPLQDRAGIALLSFRGFVLVTHEGWGRVARLISRFVSISMVLMLFMETVRSVDIIKTLRYYHLPYSVALLFSMILRFIPYLGSLFEDIRDSMSLRLNEDRNGVPILPSITAFTLSAVRMIPDTAAALEERGFGNGRHSDYGMLKSYKGLFTEFMLSAILPIIFFVVVR